MYKTIIEESVHLDAEKLSKRNRFTIWCWMKPWVTKLSKRNLFTKMLKHGCTKLPQRNLSTMMLRMDIEYYHRGVGSLWWWNMVYKTIIEESFPYDDDTWVHKAIIEDSVPRDNELCVYITIFSIKEKSVHYDAET